MQAQTFPKALTGEYYLKGVPETAAGFRLDADSSFQFFFSQGALDRFGHGHWQIKGNRIVLNSRPAPAHDYKLTESRKGPGDHVTIRIADNNEILLRYVYVILNGGRDGTTEEMTDKDGYVRFSAQDVDSIELLFQFCPEKTSLFHISQKQHNYFEFRFEPTIMEIFFKDFELEIQADGLVGANPVLQGAGFTYLKN